MVGNPITALLFAVLFIAALLSIRSVRIRRRLLRAWDSLVGYFLALLTFIRRERGHFGCALFVVSVLLIVSLAILVGLIGVVSDEKQATEPILLAISRSPGTMFVAAMAFVTAVGFIITITRIQDLASRINRYDELLIRAKDLIEREINAAESSYAEGDEIPEIRMVCTTPLHGNLTEKSKKAYEYYVRVLERARRSIRLHILHLPLLELKRFYDRFSEEGRFSKDRTNEALTESLEFLSSIEKTSRHRIEVDRSKPPHIMQHLWAEVGYRLLLSRRRAIFYVPLSLPLESVEDGPPAVSRQKETRVDMIGFETEDRFIIGQLRDNFEYLASRATRAGAEYPNSFRSGGERLPISTMESYKPEVTKSALLLLHGFTGHINDRLWRERLHFRDKAADLGFNSYEFDYRGRSSESRRTLDFSLTRAAADVDAAVRHIFEERQCKNLIVVAFGSGAYISFLSREIEDRKCPLILWQPIFYPREVMDRRGHTRAYYEAYASSRGHNFVEIGGMKFGSSFFEDLKGIKPVEELIWAPLRLTVLRTRGDELVTNEDIERFRQSLNGWPNQGEISFEELVLDSASSPLGHFHEGDIMPFIEPTLEKLESLKVG